MKNGRIKSIFTPSSGFRRVLLNYYPYCALGAVSPDYPNLITKDAAVPLWADAMHCFRTCKMIIRGIELVRNSVGSARDKQVAWLLGYTAHVVTDVTIHPVVQAKVGLYAANQRQHRICELHQDCYIYRRMNLGEIGDSDSFAMLVAQCSVHNDEAPLDFDICSLWGSMLENVHPDMFRDNPPDIQSWHREFMAKITCSTPNTPRLFPLAGAIAAKIGLAYPSYKAVDMQYIDELIVPNERPFHLHYEDIFSHALCNIATVWREVERAVCSDEQTDLMTLDDWNLDTGCDEYNRLVFW